MTPANKKFRISGIAVFVVLIGLVGVFLLLFLDGIVKDTIEDQGSGVIESQIDVGSLSTSLLSQSMDIGNLQIANADKLDENLVQAGRIKFDFDGNRALSKKVIIDDMILEGLRLNQKRETPAKPYKPANGEAEKESEDKPSSQFGAPQGLDFKNPKDILKNETLETLQVAEKTKSDLEALKTKWQTKVDQQLSKEGLAQIQQRLKDLQAKSKNLKDPSAIQSATTEIQALQKDIQTRIDTVKNFKKDLEADIRQAKKLASQIKDLPKKDFDRLRKKYSLDLKGGTGLVSKMVSGPLKTKIDKAWGYYKKISPYLKSDPDSKSEAEPEKMERGKGQFIKFTTPNPFPDFLIRRAKLSMNVWDQDVKGDFQGLTNDPRVYGKPFNLNFTGSQNEAFKQFNLKLVLDRTQAEAADLLETQVSSLKIKPVPLGDWATLSKGFADITGKIDIQNEQNVKGNFTVKVHGATFAQTGEAANEMSRVLGNVLKSVDQFYIEGVINGTPDDYSLSIKTDLDEILAKSVRKLFDGKIKTFEADLKKSIAASTAGPLADASGSVAGLMDFKDILKTEETTSKDLLSQATEKALLGNLPGADSLLKKLKLPF